MSVITGLTTYLKKIIPASTQKPVVEAYDVWSETYDNQPGNLMLDLDQLLFAELITNISFENKRIADIGCGTGRHWPVIYAKHPKLLMGFDVSGGMLDKLKEKFPQAITQHISDHQLKMLRDDFADCVISTLTIAHIRNMKEAVAEWCRILKTNGDLLVTDFHPAILAKGGKRSFQHGNKSISVTNFVHPVDKVMYTFEQNGLRVIQKRERIITEDLKHYYAAKNALHVYEKYKGMPVIYGFHLKKMHAAE